MDMGEIRWEVVGWIRMDEIRDQWRDLMNTLMNVWVL